MTVFKNLSRQKCDATLWKRRKIDGRYAIQAILGALQNAQLADIRTDSSVFATLNTITKDPLYGVSVASLVEGETVTKQYTKAIALVVTTRPTVSDNKGGGYQMTAEGVQDPFNEDCTFQLFSFCRLTTSPDYQFKPNCRKRSKWHLFPLLMCCSPDSILCFLSTTWRRFQALMPSLPLGT